MDLKFINYRKIFCILIRDLEFSWSGEIKELKLNKEDRDNNSIVNFIVLLLKIPELINM